MAALSGCRKVAATRRALRRFGLVLGVSAGGQRRRRDVREQITDYENLAKLVRFFNRWPLVPLDERAVDEFNILRKQRILLSTPDLKIASIALVHDALLLSANLRDFKKVPGLRVENWLE